MALNKKEWFMIDSKPIYLTHGNFGGSFKCAFESKMHWQKQLESNPHHFINYQLYDEIVNSRNALSKFLGCESEDLIYFPNPTTALNTVIKNIDLKHNDEVLTSNHEYGALDKTWDYYSTKKGFIYKKVCIDIPYDSKEKFIYSFLKNINKNTKVIFLSHITSSTGLIFPIKEICEIAKERNILTIIDGAHAPCHIDLNILDIDPDVYVGACHKWMCTPKGASYLYVTKSFQKFVEPLVISWGWQDQLFTKSEFVNWHQWQGTNDFSSYLTVPIALDFIEKNNWNLVRDKCKNLILKTKEILNDSSSVCFPTSNNNEHIGQMLSFTVNQNSSLVQDIKKDPTKILYYQAQIFEKSNIHIPIIFWNNQVFIRVSIQAYNSSNDVDSMFKMLDLFNLL